RRYYATDITTPFELREGHLDVPTGPGIGVDPIPDILDEVTTSTEWITL
ncbi:o-succinylbenzoate synthase, partial [Streptosporangium canum]